MTKRVNHVVASSPDRSTSSASKKDTSIPPLVNSGPGPSSGALPPPPTVIHTKEDTTTNTQDDAVQDSPKESEGVILTRGSIEETENRTFDQVLDSLNELTDKHCETVQVNTGKALNFVTTRTH